MIKYRVVKEVETYVNGRTRTCWYVEWRFLFFWNRVTDIFDHEKVFFKEENAIEYMNEIYEIDNYKKPKKTKEVVCER